MTAFANQFEYQTLLELVWDGFIEQGDSYLMKVAVAISMVIDEKYSVDSFEMMVVVFKNAQKVCTQERVKEMIEKVDDKQVERILILMQAEQ